MDFINGQDFYKMSLEDIKVLVNKVSSQANQQIKELEDTGYYTLSQAYKRLQSRQGKDRPSFSTNLEGLTKQQLYGKYVRAVDFMTLKTSNVEGTKEVNVEIYKNMGYSEEQAKEMIKDVIMDELRKFKKNFNTEDSYVNFRQKYGFDIKEYWDFYRRIEETDVPVNYDSFQLQEKLKTYVVDTGDYENVSNFSKYVENEFNKEHQEEYEKQQEENERMWGEDIEDEF